MYPFYIAAYRGKDIHRAMNFKKVVYGFSNEEYRDFYANLDSISRHRTTDLNELSICTLIQSIPEGTKNLLDVGCGRGYFLNRIAESSPDIALTGCDVVDKLDYDGIELVNASAVDLPFEDNSFDVVTCSHTLEHILNLSAAINELKRVARNILFIVVPRQRYYFYTLDEHVNFFPQSEILENMVGLDQFVCLNLQGDWLYRAYVNCPEPIQMGISKRAVTQ